MSDVKCFCLIDRFYCIYFSYIVDCLKKLTTLCWTITTISYSLIFSLMLILWFIVYIPQKKINLRIRQNIYFIVSILNDMSISTALIMYFIYLLQDDLKNTHKPYILYIYIYIVTVLCFLFHQSKCSCLLFSWATAIVGCFLRPY